MLPNRTPLLALLGVLIVPLLAPRKANAQSLRGSRSSINRMYLHAVDHGIYFYKTSDGIRRAAREGRFTRLAGNADYATSGVSFPFVRPETRTFVERLAGQYRRACGERMVVTSASRPKSMRLLNGSDRSVHPTGIAVDLRKPSNRRCRAWLRSTLVELEGAGLLEATEEYHPPHFHVAVFPQPYARYVKAKGARVRVASAGDEARYEVRSGDSLWTIARRHDTTVSRLKAANGLRSDRLRIGQVLRIPGER